MNVTMMKGKIHRATVTEADLHYEGSISIDRDLSDAAGFFINERVEIYNIDTGARFATYVIEGKRGSGVIGLNGAAARLAMPGDKVIIVAYADMSAEEARIARPERRHGRRRQPDPAEGSLGRGCRPRLDVERRDGLLQQPPSSVRRGRVHRVEVEEHLDALGLFAQHHRPGFLVAG